MSSVFTFVCVCLCVCVSVCLSVRLSVGVFAGYRAHLLLLTQETHFWVELFLGQEKETHFFCFFINFHRYAFYWHFFSSYNTGKFLVSSYWSQFFIQDCDIWVEKTLYHQKLKTFEKVHFFMVKGFIFLFFTQFFILGILEISMTCNLSF